LTDTVHIVGYVAAAIVVICSFWVAFDSSALGAKGGMAKGVAGLGSFIWWLFTLILFPIAFPLYLAKRPLIKVAGEAAGRGDLVKWRANHIQRDAASETELHTPTSAIYARTAHLSVDDAYQSATPAAATAPGTAVEHGFGQPATSPSTGTVSVEPDLMPSVLGDPRPVEPVQPAVAFPSFAAAQVAASATVEHENHSEPARVMTPLKMPEPVQVGVPSNGSGPVFGDLVRSTEPALPVEPALPLEPASTVAAGHTAETALPLEPAAKPLPPAGWYPDPNNATRLRYWDGKVWAAPQG
jgi:hypothetical protein